MLEIGERSPCQIVAPLEDVEFPFLELPVELVLNILLLIRPVDIARLSLVSRKYKVFLDQTNFWKMFHVSYFPRISIKADLYLDFQQSDLCTSALIKKNSLDLVYQRGLNRIILQFLHFTNDALYIGTTSLFHVDLVTCQEKEIGIESSMFIKCIAVSDDTIYATSNYSNCIFSFALNNDCKKTIIDESEGRDVTSLSVFRHFLFVKKIHQFNCIHLQTQELKQLFSSKIYSLFGPIAFFNDYVFQSYTNAKIHFGFLAKNFKTNESIEALCVSVEDERGFSGFYEIHGELLFLKFKNGNIQSFNLLTLQSKVIELDAQHEVICIARSLKGIRFIRMNEEHCISICDEEKNEIFKKSESTVNAKCVCLYKDYLVLGLNSGYIEIWEVNRNKLLFHFKPFAEIICEGNLILSVKVVCDKLILTSLLGQLEIYNLDFFLNKVKPIEH